MSCGFQICGQSYVDSQFFSIFFFCKNRQQIDLFSNSIDIQMQKQVDKITQAHNAYIKRFNKYIWNQIFAINIYFIFRKEWFGNSSVVIKKKNILIDAEWITLYWLGFTILKIIKKHPSVHTCLSLRFSVSLYFFFSFFILNLCGCKKKNNNQRIRICIRISIYKWNRQRKI